MERQSRDRFYYVARSGSEQSEQANRSERSDYVIERCHVVRVSRSEITYGPEPTEP